jgi:hypothetical protein
LLAGWNGCAPGTVAGILDSSSMSSSDKPPYLAAFDSATAMARALAACLHGSAFIDLGQARWLHPFVGRAEWVPHDLRTWIFSVAGAREGVRPDEIDRVDGNAIAGWLAGLYPRREFPAVMIGSSSGAMTHLAAALGIPWLPQTVLVPVRRAQRADPDDPELSLSVGTPAGERLLARNPELQLHHMHDPNQDRLMVQRMMYFRLKWRRLPYAYRAYLTDVLPRGATLMVSDCRRRWRTTRVGERHVFQLGALGGAEEAEFHQGSVRVSALLRRLGATRDRWPQPVLNETSAEAEWGFEDELAQDLAELAHERGWHIERIAFGEPADPSPAVAELYRAHYRSRGLPDDNLLVGSFVLLDPLRTLQLGAVPFWLTFPMEPSADWLEGYLDAHGPFARIWLTLFAHGVDSIGLPPVERWRAILCRAEAEGRFIGVDEKAYPAHFGVYARFGDALQRIPRCYPVPPPWPLGETLASLRLRLAQPDVAAAAETAATG